MTRSDYSGAHGGRDEVSELSADEARQGRVVLRKQWQKAVFLIGLFAAFLVAIALVAWVAIL